MHQRTKLGYIILLMVAGWAAANTADISPDQADNDLHQWLASKHMEDLETPLRELGMNYLEDLRFAAAEGLVNADMLVELNAKRIPSERLVKLAKELVRWAGTETGERELITSVGVPFL